MNFPSLNSLLLGKQYIGIEHYSLNNEEYIAVLLIENKKEELVIVKKDRVSYSETLHEKWNKSLPFFLVINTNQVIQKEIDGIDLSDDKLTQKAFPNTDWEEFYYEVWRIKTKSIIAISRKIYVDQLLSTYEKQGVSVAGISLGVCSVAEVINYTDREELHTNHQTVSWSEATTVIKTSRIDSYLNYKINSLVIQNSHVLAFSGVLRLLLNGAGNSGNGIQYSEQLLENYNQRSFFVKGLKFLTGILLGILMVNFFVFSHYYRLDLATSESLLLSKSSQEELNKIKQRILFKEQKIKNVVGLTSSKSSLVLNELIKRMPQSILLTELIYHPLEKKIKEEESIITQRKVVIVSGTTMDNEALTHWIESIGQFNWINNVVITHFGKNDTNETQFSIKVLLK
jgi:hypothetical protein